CRLFQGSRGATPPPTLPLPLTPAKGNMAASIRQKKVGAEIQRIVAGVLQQDVSDPRVDGLVSVTRVEMSPDLREARVYISILGGQRTPETMLQGIKSAGRHIQSQVAEGVTMRFA